jgi:hypothetical protein
VYLDLCVRNDNVRWTDARNIASIPEKMGGFDNAKVRALATADESHKRIADDEHLVRELSLEMSGKQEWVAHEDPDLSEPIL